MTQRMARLGVQPTANCERLFEDQNDSSDGVAFRGFSRGFLSSARDDEPWISPSRSRSRSRGGSTTDEGEDPLAFRWAEMAAQQMGADLDAFRQPLRDPIASCHRHDKHRGVRNTLALGWRDICRLRYCAQHAVGQVPPHTPW